MEVLLLLAWVVSIWEESVVKQTSITTRAQLRHVISKYIKMHLCQVEVLIQQTLTLWQEVVVNWQMEVKDSITGQLTQRIQCNEDKATPSVELQWLIQPWWALKVMASPITKPLISGLCPRTLTIASSNSPIVLSKIWMAMDVRVSSQEAVDQVRVRLEQLSRKVNMQLIRKIQVLERIHSARKRKCQVTYSVVERTNTISHPLGSNNTEATERWRWEIEEIECWVLDPTAYLTLWSAKFKAQR